MKIVFFCMKFPLSSETFVLNQIVSFIEMGHDVEVVSVFPGDLQKTHESFDKYNLINKTTYLMPSEDGTKIQRMLGRLSIILRGKNKLKVIRSFNLKKYRYYGKNLLLPSLISSIKNKISADFFIVHFGFSGVLANNLRSLEFLDGKIATVFHGLDISKNEVLESFEQDYKILFREGDLFLPISNLWSNKLKTLGCEDDKIHVIRMGIQTDGFKFKPKKSLNIPIRLVSVARLVEKKGLDIAIKACVVLKNRGVNFQYEIIGTGPQEKYLNSLIEKFELKSNVILSGFKTQEHIKKILNDSDVFLLPSVTASDGDMEGIPVALMEAMAVGLPVISTYHSGIPELIDNNKSGWLAPEFDCESLAEIITKIVNGDNYIDEITINARKKIENIFDERSNYNDLAKLLEQKA